MLGSIVLFVRIQSDQSETTSETQILFTGMAKMISINMNNLHTARWSNLHTEEVEFC